MHVPKCSRRSFVQRVVGEIAISNNVGGVKDGGRCSPRADDHTACLHCRRPELLEDLDKNYDGPLADIVGPNVLNAWIHGDLLTVNMLGMSHPEFSSMFQRRESAQRFAENQVADYGRDDANTSYAWVALYTFNFLNAYQTGGI